MIEQLFIFHATDYKHYPLGGTLGTIKNYLKFSQFECVLVGIANDNHTKVGSWHKIRINSKYYDFLPIARSRKGLIPHKMLMLTGTTLFAQRILKKCNSHKLNAMLFVNRECHFPVKHILGRKKEINIFYKMTEAVNPLTTSSHPLAKIRLFQYIYFNLFIKSLLLDATRVFSITKECRRFCEQVVMQKSEKMKIVDVPHYVDYNFLLDLYENSEPSQEKRANQLIFWGRLAPVKGLDLMIRSTRALCDENVDLELVLIGDGPERMNLETLVRELMMTDRIVFLGRRDIKAIAKLSKCSDLFVMSSHSEGVPTSALEALTFGLPILATAVGGITTLVSVGLNGYLVRGRNVEEYTNGIKKALRLDRKKAADYGRRLVRRSFSAQSVVGMMDQYMAEAMEGHLTK